MSVSLVDADALAPVFFATLFLGVMLALGYVLHLFVADLVISFILVGLFKKPFEICKKRLTRNPWFASGLTTVAILFIIVAPTVGLIYTITTEATTAYAAASQSFESDGVVNQAHGLAQAAGLEISRQTILAYIEHLAAEIQELALTIGSRMLGDVLAVSLHLTIVVVMVFYMQVDGERLRDFVFRLSPLPDHEDALIVETFKKVSRGVIIGNGLGSLIQGFLGGMAMWVVGLPSPILWGSVMTLFAFLPLLGISVVTIPAGLVLLFRGETTSAVGFLGFCFMQGLIVENVVKTKLMGSAMRLHDLLVFLSILGGLTAFGVIGLVYGPLIAMLFMTLNDLYIQEYRPKIALQFGRRVR